MSEPLSLPLSACPDPALQYEIRDGEPVVATTNEPCASAFDATDGAAVADLFAAFPVVDAAGEGDPLDSLRDGEGDDIYLGSFGGGPAYVVRVLPAEGGGGYLLFSEADAVRELTERAGVEEVASAVSHDLRNPLDVAEAHLHAARETGEEEHFEAVADAHDRMEAIVEDVLTLVRGDAVIDPDPAVSIRDAAADAWASVDTDAADLRLDESLPTTAADAERVQRLFENLYRNAVEHGSTSSRAHSSDAPDHAGPAAGAVTVTVGALDGGVYVADDGPGIPNSEREAVFSPGYTVDGGGTGLGLAIVRRIAEAHGWSVTVTESDRGGTRIEIRFDL